MTQALYTSATGLKAGTNQLSVVSNNVANLNTTAFKASSVNFETLFYTKLSSSSTASVTTGGVNANQIGHGVQIGSISRNNTQGTYYETGQSSDMMISGNGYFVVTDSDGRTYLTRDGSFSLDANGYLVTASGYYVMGATDTYSTTSSDVKVYIPTSLDISVDGTATADFEDTLISELNNAGLTSGTFTITVNSANAGVSQAVEISISQDDLSTMTIDTFISSINSQLSAASITGVTATADTGTIVFECSDDYACDFGADGDTSNFVQELGLSGLDQDADGNYVSDILNYSVTIGSAVTYNTAVTLDEWSVSSNGIITATYSDGTTLTATVDENGQTGWKVVTSDYISITGDDVNVDENVLTESNFILELASVVNEDGLEATTNNLYTIGANSGTVYFGIAGYSSFGAIQTGGLEASNVELATELSSMILAQTLVNANSRVFNGANEMMQTLVYLGQ